MSDPRKRSLRRADAREERVLAVMLAAALVFLVLSVVEAAEGSGAPRARRHAAVQRTPPTGSPTAGPATSSAPEPPSTTGVRTPAPAPSQAPSSPPRLRMLAVHTEPPIPNVSFAFAGTIFTSDVPSGVALLVISGDEHDRLVTDPLHELTVTTPAVPLRRGARAVFAGWVGPVRFDGTVDTAVARFRVAA